MNEPERRLGAYEPKSFWQERALRLGPRSVGYVQWSEEDLRRHTDAIRSRMFRHLRAQPIAPGQALLDFGCGTGHFAFRLAEVGFRVTGVDIAPAMLRLARLRRARPNPRSMDRARTTAQDPLPVSVCVQLRPVKNPHFVLVDSRPGLPFRSATFDVLWTHAVLEHVPDADFERVVAELVRVLVPGGLAVLCENTFRHHRRTSELGHVVFRSEEEYRTAFPGVRVVDRILVEGQRHSLFVGRLSQRTGLRPPGQKRVPR